MISKINIVFIAMCFYFTKANKEEDIKLAYLQFILDCAKELNVTPAEISDLAKYKLPVSDSVKCLLACTYKKIGMTDEEGKLSVEGMKKIAETAYADEPNMKAKSEMFTNACLYVNEEEITGDKKECERAAKIFKCSIENDGIF